MEKVEAEIWCQPGEDLSPRMIVHSFDNFLDHHAEEWSPDNDEEWNHTLSSFYLYQDPKDRLWGMSLYLLVTLPNKAY